MLEIREGLNDALPMSKVEQIEAELEKRSAAELKQAHEWLEDFVEDRLGFTPAFETAIQESEQEMSRGNVIHLLAVGHRRETYRNV